VLTDTVHAPLMAEAAELPMHTIATAIDALPKSADPEISQKAGPILADLRKLEVLAANAAATRRALLRAARSPSATLGQRLYGARHRAELSVDEAANAAGVLTAVLQDAESERSVPRDAAAAIETLIAQLAMS
jgi:DNA-binding transcriptional regulator YiaG